MKINHTLPLILFAVACGNPHLTKVDGLGSKFVPLIVNPDGLKNGPALHIKDSLNVKTKDASIVTPIQVQNLDNENGWKVECKLEKGEHFRIISGTCKAEIQAAEACDLNIDFFATTPDIYLDNLIVTYSREGKTAKCSSGFINSV